MLTGAFLDVAALLERVAAQLAMEVVLPELGKPDVAPVVVQRTAGEVAVESWQGTRTSGPHEPPSPTCPQSFRLPSGLEMAPGRGKEKGKSTASDPGPRRKKKQTVERFISFKMKRAVLGARGSMYNLTTVAFMEEKYTMSMFLHILTTKMLISGLFQKKPPGGPEIRVREVVGVAQAWKDLSSLVLKRGPCQRG